MRAKTAVFLNKLRAETLLSLHIACSALRASNVKPSAFRTCDLPPNVSENMKFFSPDEHKEHFPVATAMNLSPRARPT